jgi:small multidrug resistance pump
MPREEGGSGSWRSWLYAAAIYNVLWGSWVILAPTTFFRLIGTAPPSLLAIWQVVGMFVLLWAPAFLWAGRYPERHGHLMLICLIGKILGPIGFVGAAVTGSLPMAFGLTIITNDLIWWPALAVFVARSARRHGGWRPFLAGA